MQSEKLQSQDKKTLYNKSISFGTKMITGFNSSPTPFHYAKYASRLLKEEGFVELNEKENWADKIKKGGKYFLVRNFSSIMAFVIGNSENISPETTSFAIIGGHTDSPTLRLCPNSYISDNTYDKYNTQTYGGGQWQTWFDRDLSAGGKIVYENKDEKLVTEIFDLEKPLFFLPNLCIHLRKDKENFYWNNEDNLKLLSSTSFYDDITYSDQIKREDEKENDERNDLGINSNGQSEIEKKIGKKLALEIAKQIGVNDLNKIYDYNIVLYDTQKADFLGFKQEFISSARFDNQGTAISSIYSIIDFAKDINKVNSSNTISFLANFDSEEIGSMTYQGASSVYLKTIISRVYEAFSNSFSLKITKPENPNLLLLKFENDLQSCLARSFFLSCDMAHLYHPNYQGYYQVQHKPLPHFGPVIKTNVNGRYASEAEGVSLIKMIAKKIDVPLQDFMVRQDFPCGTTIGPIISSNTGIKTVDIGCPQLAMHSIREQTAITDIYYLYQLFIGFYDNYFSVSDGFL